MRPLEPGISVTSEPSKTRRIRIAELDAAARYTPSGENRAPLMMEPSASGHAGHAISAPV